MTTDPGEKADVVDDRSLGFAQAEMVRQGKSDEARSLNVLHRLSRAEVGGQREGGNQLGQANSAPIGFTGHR